MEQAAEGMASAQITGNRMSFKRNEEKQIDIVVESEEEKIAERITLNACLSALSEKDRAIIEYRYFKGETQTVVAKRLGMTQVQVSRREKVILKEMRLKMVV
jgi:RNA polymerase sporulation-specific sigma factor